MKKLFQLLRPHFACYNHKSLKIVKTALVAVFTVLLFSLTIFVSALPVAAYNAGNTIATAWNTIRDPNKTYTWQQAGVDLLTLGLSAYSMKTSFDGLVTTSKTSYCFVAGTLVSTAAGFVSIEDVEVGDLVTSKDRRLAKLQRKLLYRLLSTKQTN